LVAALGLPAAVYAAFLWSCADPTEITVTVDLSFPCTALGGSVGVAVGDPGALETLPVVSRSVSCEDGHMGSVVVSPKAAKDAELGIRVLGGYMHDTADCEKQFGPGCIVSRRMLRFFPHTDLVVPIVLDSRCAGVLCLPTETCVGGACISAQLDCHDDGTCAELPDGGPGDSGADGGNDSGPQNDGGDDGGSDAGPLDDGGADGGDGGVVGIPVGGGCGDPNSGLRAGAAWPTYGYCSGHMGRSPFKGPAKLIVAPQIVPVSALPSTMPAPAIDESANAVFVDAMGTLQSVHIADGTVNWSLSDKNMRAGGPVSLRSDGLAIYTAAHQEVIGYAPNIQPPPIHLSPLDKLSDPVIGAGGVVFVGMPSGVGMYSTSFALLTLLPTPKPVEAAPAIAPNGDVVAVTTDGRLYVFRPDGTEIDVVLGDQVENASPPIVDASERIFVVTKAGSFLAYDAQLQRLWPNAPSLCGHVGGAIPLNNLFAGADCNSTVKEVSALGATTSVLFFSTVITAPPLYDVAGDLYVAAGTWVGHLPVGGLPQSRLVGGTKFLNSGAVLPDGTWVVPAQVQGQGSLYLFKP
jgi:hypothetical protein